MVRILVCGDLRGQLRQLCEQISRQHAKLDAAQHFKAVFCVGEFGAGDLPADVAPPVPVYFVDASPAARDLIAASPQGAEIRPGIHFLGHYGVAKILGLTVVYLSGRYRSELFEGDSSAMMTGGAVEEGDSSHAVTWEELRAKEKAAEVGNRELFVDECYTPLAIERLKEEITEAGGVDLLLTSEWPAGCLRGVPKEARANLDKATVQRHSSPAVAEIAAQAEPKYHVAGLCGTFWRRPPWRHERRGEVVQSTGDLRCGACRIVAMGSLGGGASASSGSGGGGKPAAPELPPGGQAPGPTKPQQWLHGLSLEPNTAPAAGDDATPSPWSAQAADPKPDPGANEGLEGPAHPLSFLADAESKRRWMKRFGATPADLQSASDKIAQANQPKDEDNKKKRRQSLYPTEKDNKRKRGGAADHEHFAMRERKAAGRANCM